jgi:signal transduction histidine kinase
MPRGIARDHGGLVTWFCHVPQVFRRGAKRLTQQALKNSGAVAEPTYAPPGNISVAGPEAASDFVMRALLVEQDAVERQALVESLRARGHVVTACANVAEGIEHHTTSPFPLIVVGTVTPSEGAIELCKQARALRQGDVPVILLWADVAGHETEMRALEAGADDYLPTAARASLLATRLMIAESRALERSLRSQLEQRVLLSEHMASLGTLTAGIAHELNNPLTYVLANLRFLHEDLRGLERTVPEPQLNALKELIAQAAEGAERVQTIVMDLKKFSRVDTDEEQATDVERVLDAAINMAWNEIKHRARVEKRYDSVPTVRGHEARLGQVFVNLLINAAQAIPIGRASSHTITVATYARGERVMVEVTDTGAGMPETVIHRIFEPFFTTKPVGIGTGLGLSICRDIVNAIGGEISVESAIGKGSTFRVSLPQARHSAVRPRVMPSLPAQADKRALRILVVDDEPNVLKALERALKGHNVTTAQSGQAALDVLEAGPSFDLVFCDLMMADVSGMDIYGQVRRRRPGMEESFIFMTGGVFTQQATDFLASIPNPVVHKPFDLRALRKLVGQRIAA